MMFFQYNYPPRVELVLSHNLQLLLSNGAPAGLPLIPGKYVAELNQGQQPGVYSIYEADSVFNKTNQNSKIANARLTFLPNGYVAID